MPIARPLAIFGGAAVIVVGSFLVTTYVLNWSSSALVNSGSRSSNPVAGANQQAAPQPVLEKGAGGNLLWPSQDFAANGGWARTAVSIQPAAGIAPSGDNTGSKLVEASTNGRHLINRIVQGATPGAIHTFSLFFKPAERSTIRFEIMDTNPAKKYGNAVCNLPNSEGAAGTLTKVGDIVGGRVDPVSDGWFRCWAAMPFSVSEVSVGIEMGGPGGVFGYQGDGHSGILIWGAQFELGGQPTSYVATSTGPIAKSK
jgi:hypothetical protein